jgi:hypothetical protein
MLPQGHYALHTFRTYFLETAKSKCELCNDNDNLVAVLVDMAIFSNFDYPAKLQKIHRTVTDKRLFVQLLVY